MVFTFGRLATVSVTPQIGDHQGEVARELRRDLVPHDVGLWIAVEEQQRWAFSSDHGIDRDIFEIDFLAAKLGRETTEPPRCRRPSLLSP
jgi:hypothetical protein